MMAFVDPKDLAKLCEQGNYLLFFNLNARSTNNKKDELDLLLHNMSVSFDIVLSKLEVLLLLINLLSFGANPRGFYCSTVRCAVHQCILNT